MRRTLRDPSSVGVVGRGWRGWLSVVLLGVMAGGAGCTSSFYSPSREQLGDPGLAGLSPEDVTIQTSDGEQLHGWYFRNRLGVRPRAVVLHFHGRSGNITSDFVNLCWVLDYPYDYLIFDYRGYGNSSGAPSPEGTILDGKAALLWLRARVGETPVVVYGQSLGGAIALRTLIEMHGSVPVALIVVESAFASYQAAARHFMTRSILTWPVQWMVYLAVSDSKAPGDDIATLAPVPLIVIHGTDDEAVDISLGRKVYELAREPKEFWEVPGGRHIDAMSQPDAQWRKRLLARIAAALAARQMGGP